MKLLPDNIILLPKTHFNMTREQIYCSISVFINLHFKICWRQNIFTKQIFVCCTCTFDYWLISKKIPVCNKCWNRFLSSSKHFLTRVIHLWICNTIFAHCTTLSYFLLTFRFVVLCYHLMLVMFCYH